MWGRRDQVGFWDVLGRLSQKCSRDASQEEEKGLLDFGVAAVEDIGANLQEMLVDSKLLVIAILFREIDENVFHLHRVHV